MANTSTNTIHVDIVSAEGEIFSGAARCPARPANPARTPWTPRHAPLLTLLKPGEVRVQTPDGAEQHFFVGGGAIEVQPNRVSVLADTALRAKDLDENAALAAKQRAEEALAKATDKIGEAEALKELVRMAEQVKMIQRLRKGK